MRKKESSVERMDWIERLRKEHRENEVVCEM